MPEQSEFQRALRDIYFPEAERQLNSKLYLETQFRKSPLEPITRRTRIRFWFRRLQPLYRVRMAYRAFKDPYSGYWD